MAKLITSVSKTHSMESLLPLSLIMFLYFATTPPATCLSNETDFSALLAFKNGIIDDPLGALRSWNDTVHDFCDWEGIMCSQRHRVVSVNLMSRGLVGSLPPHLGNLSFLRVFVLQNNSFGGKIPEDIGRLRQLQLVDFSNNSFSGQISPGILSLSFITNYFNLAHNALTGSIPQDQVGGTPPCNLEFLDLSQNRLSGVISRDLGNCDELRWLHLENNSLMGEIPAELIALEHLEDLDLSQNNLSGQIPSFLDNYELKLKNLNLSYNRLQGEVPTSGVFRDGNAISLEGNEHLCGGLGFLNLPPCSSTTNFRKKFLTSVLGAGAASFALLTCIGIFVYRRRTLQEVQPLVPSFPDFFLRLSYADLVKATFGFSKANLLGSGTFGSVYIGNLAGEGQQHMFVAVKVLNLEIKGASKCFMSECGATKEIRHKNLLKILSVCDSIDFQGNSFKALVYEFMANGSLDKWLHNESIRNLSIEQKLKIVIDVAAAVVYLHHGTNSILIHGDLKPSNILLDENMTAHMGDFGLAKVVSNIYPTYDGSSSSSLAIKGTLGYIPPEYGMTNSMTMQGDVYSFGILVLEMFTNRRPTDDVALNDQPSLHHLVSHALQSQEMNVVDQIIPREYRNDRKTRNCVAYLLEVGVACSQQLPKDRMKMTDVVSELDKIRNSSGLLG